MASYALLTLSCTLCTLFGGTVASGCAVVNASICMAEASNVMGMSAVNCDGFYDCLEPFECSAHDLGLPERALCQNLESCDAADFISAGMDCFMNTDTCSELYPCLGKYCSAIREWIYPQYCPSGVQHYCTLNHTQSAVQCIFSQLDRQNCSELIECLTPNSCDTITTIRLLLPVECQALLPGTAGATTLTATIGIMTLLLLTSFWRCFVIDG